MNAEKSKHPPSKKPIAKGVSRRHCMRSIGLPEEIWTKMT
jgi:hypothetical protein